MSDAHRVTLFEDGRRIGEDICNLLQSLGLVVIWVDKILGLYQEGALVRCPVLGVGEAYAEIILLQWDNLGSVLLVDGRLGPSGHPNDGPHGWHVLKCLRDSVPAQLRRAVLISAHELDNSMMADEHSVPFATDQKHRNFDGFAEDIRQAFSKLGLLQTNVV